MSIIDQERITRQLDDLCARLNAAPDGDGECWIDCPACGKGGKHFSFSERGYKCFACGFAGRSLITLAERLELPNLTETRQQAPRLAVRADRPRGWQGRPDTYLDRYCGALDRVEKWQQYKPLTLDSIGRHRLGVGKLPMWSKERRQWYEWPHRRLVVPIFQDGRVVAFHGRAISEADKGAKWLAASGSDKRMLVVIGELRPGCTVVVVENYADAIYAHQVEPSACYIPIGGVSMWQPEWTARIVQARPRQVLVWLDHDLRGNGSRWHHREMLAEWRAEIEARRAANPKLQALPFPADPEPAGPKIANELLAAGVRARIFEWKRGTPPKADIGWALMQERAA
jgi:hypothetical protein